MSKEFWFEHKDGTYHSPRFDTKDDCKKAAMEYVKEHDVEVNCCGIYGQKNSVVMMGGVFGKVIRDENGTLKYKNWR